MNLLFCLIIVPFIASALVYLFKVTAQSRVFWALILFTAFNLVCALIAWCKEIFFYHSIGGFGFEIAFRLYSFSASLALLIAIFAFIGAIYSRSMLENPKYRRFVSGMLMAVSFANGVLLADNLLVLLFFWEAIIIPLFMMLTAGKTGAYKVGLKAFITFAVADLFLMFGVIAVYSLTNTLTISEIKLDFANPLAVAAFLAMVVAASAKLGAMPFQGWISDACEKANVLFMAFMVSVVEKVLGIYLLVRLVQNMFALEAGSCISLSAVSFAVITMVFAAVMSLAQKDYKKMLVYAGISQAGFIMAAITSGVSIAITAAVFHLVSYCVYKTTLFYTAGNIESQTGTTELKYMGGLAAKMPFTFMCFILGACSMAGLVPFGAFFSKEFLYESFLNFNGILFILALLSTLLITAAIFGWGKVIFAGPLNKRFKNISEAGDAAVIATVFVAFLCLLGGIFKGVILNIFVYTNFPVIENHGGFVLGAVSFVLTVLIFINAHKGYAREKNYLGVFAYLSKALRLEKIESATLADPYNLAKECFKAVAAVCFYTDKALNWVYDVALVRGAWGVSFLIRRAHNGSLPMYLVWAVGGIIIIFIVCI
jgi:formate hydrogenlyase subunit 3/multisubunit Na+/H+ antiporter MnhD subunit